MTYPIPLAALDDRLAFVGTSGSGKTYAAGVLVEALLSKKRRTIIIDPLGVWYGLRADPDGKASSAFNVVIFGGPHGDLPITPFAGALVGEAVAGSAESCIVDLSQLGAKAAERRFMLAFLEALYRNVKGEPVHLVIDEADMWAPQKLLDKEGEAAKLLGMMETVVRRGRVRGFIPWLITQRPAVLSKDVLSQADGLAIFKLTSSQDRDAIGDWVEGQADKGQWKEIYGALAGKERGHAVIWLPGHGVLTSDVAFPQKATFDSSATPKRGEKRRTAALKALDVGALKERLATVEAEVKASDPATLKKRIVELEAAARKAAVAAPSKTIERLVEKVVVDRRAITEAEKRARNIGELTGRVDGLTQAAGYVAKYPIVSALEAIDRDAAAVDERRQHALGEAHAANEIEKYVPRGASSAEAVQRAIPGQKSNFVTKEPKATVEGALERPLQKIVDAIAWWHSLAIAAPSKPQVAFRAGYAPGGGSFARYMSELRSRGLIEGRGGDGIMLTEAGRGAAASPETPATVDDLHAAILGQIDAPLVKILKPLLAAFPDAVSKSDLGAASGYEPAGGSFARYLSSLRSLELIERRGEPRAQEWLFP